MRTTTLFCASFLLALCVSAQQPPPPKKTPQKAADKKGTQERTNQQRPFQNNDSTPIIISDGSIHVKHGKPNKDFPVSPLNTHADINLTSYSPNAVGFLCDPSLYKPINPACTRSTQTCSTKTTNTRVCKADVSTAKFWTLSLCETTSSCPIGKGSTVELNWKGSSPTKIEVDSHQNNFQHVPANGNNGGEVIHNGSGHLKSATLQVTPQSGPDVLYRFDNSGGKRLIVGYNCSTGHC